ncbi:MAG: hypothetical protein ABIT96_11080 [Ferruginibacter sp.]
MPGKNDMIFGAIDFERYHKGDMSPAEMHALEKAALEDAFLADALEGYAFTATPVYDIETLEKKIFFKKEDNKKIFTLYPAVKNLLKIAAVLLVIISASWFLLRNNGDEETSATRYSDNTLTTPASRDSPTGGSVESLPADSAISYSDVVVEQKELSSTLSKAAPGNTTFQAETQALKPAKDVEPGNKSISKDNLTKALAGKVSGVKIRSIEEQNMEATKNMDTSYFTSPAAASPFPSLAESGASRDAEASKARRLNEVSATTKAASMQKISSIPEKDNTKAPPRITVTNAIPLQGWAGFNTYVNDDLKTVEELNQAVRADIELSFDVDDAGKPIHIEAAKSLCKPCEKEAIRVLSGGPGWKLNDRGARAAAVVRF